MSSFTSQKRKAELKMLTRAFAKSLIKSGFAEKDLVRSATVLIDEAIRIKGGGVGYDSILPLKE